MSGAWIGGAITAANPKRIRQVLNRALYAFSVAVAGTTPPGTAVFHTGAPKTRGKETTAGACALHFS